MRLKHHISIFPTGKSRLTRRADYGPVHSVSPYVGLQMVEAAQVVRDRTAGGVDFCGGHEAGLIGGHEGCYASHVGQRCC